MAKHTKVAYENNPFNVGLNGLKSLFTNAQSVAIYAIVLSVVSLIANLISNLVDVLNDPEITGKAAKPAEAAFMVNPIAAGDIGALLVLGIIVASIIFAVMVVMFLLYGVLDYTGAQLAKGKQVKLDEAFGQVAKQLASYIWVMVIATVKIFLWSLLFIVPGFIMAFRYMLAGTVFFAEGKKGNAAIKRSLELTKGAWFTTFASYNLWNLITLGAITPLLQPGVNSILYRQFKETTDSKQEKPAAHWLSWLTFFGPIALFALLILFVLLIVVTLGTLYGWR